MGRTYNGSSLLIVLTPNTTSTSSWFLLFRIFSSNNSITYFLFSIANDDTVFYFLTNSNAPQFKLVSVDISVPEAERVWKDIIVEDKDAHLENVIAVGGDKLAVVYKRNVSARAT